MDVNSLSPGGRGGHGCHSLQPRQPLRPVFCLTVRREADTFSGTMATARTGLQVLTLGLSLPAL